MPFDSIKIEQGLPSNLADTLVDVVPALGHVWIICTDKVYLYDYHESIPSRNQAILAYTFSGTGAERISCGIGYQGYLYIGTWQPDHASNARILRLAPNGTSVTSLTSNDGTFLTATASLSTSAATSGEHGFLNLAQAENTLLAYYILSDTTASVYRQTAIGTWDGTVFSDVTYKRIVEATHRTSRNSVLMSGEASAGIVFWQSDGAFRFAKLTLSGDNLRNAEIVTGAQTNQPHIGKGVLGYVAWDDADSSYYAIEGGWHTTEIFHTYARKVDLTSAWYEGYGSDDTLTPAFIDEVIGYGGVPYGDTFFAGFKLTEDDGGGSDTVRHLLVYREPDGNWVVGESLAETGTLYAPKYTAYLNGKLRVIAPHVDENNFSIITPDAATGRWLTRRGL